MTGGNNVSELFRRESQHSKHVFSASVRLLSREDGGLRLWFLLERRGVGVRNAEKNIASKCQQAESCIPSAI